MSIILYIRRNHDLPVMGICYGMQELAHVFGGAVSASEQREFGRAFIDKNTSKEGLTPAMQGNDNSNHMTLKSPHPLMVPST